MLTITTNLEALIMNKKRCPNCHTYNKPSKRGVKLINNRLFCNESCMFNYVNNSRIKAKSKKVIEKSNKKAVIDLNRQKLSWQHSATQIVFNKLRRLQEFKWFKDKGIEPYCISCGKEHMDWCNGHFKTVGGNGRLRYDVKNSYLQCNTHCNKHLSGNIENYKVGLIKRFGEDQARHIRSYCEENTHSIKWHWQDIEAMRKQFNAEIRLLEKELL